MKSIYLDYAAATPMDPVVLAAMKPYFLDRFYNPSATYLAARAVKDDLADFRAKLAAILGCRPAEIVFTAGATEANNLAIQGVMEQFPDAEVLVSAIEHESVLAPAELFESKLIPADDKGAVILNKLSNLITDKTVLVSMMLVNNELGTVQPLREAANLIQTIKKTRLEKGNRLPIYLHCDAAQATNYLDLHTSRLGVDLISINGGKIYGPKQSGMLYVKAGTKLWPQIVGGGQEFNLRSGTENVAAIAGFVKAIELASQDRLEEAKRLTELRQHFESLALERIPNLRINGLAKHRAPHILSLTIEGYDNERLMMELDEKGVQCAVGSACSASSQEASHVLRAIGFNEAQARSTLRFSLGRQTTKQDIDRTIELLAELTESNR
jgi:cysteine desulfurase